MTSPARRSVRPALALVPALVGVFIAADDQTVMVTILPQVMHDLKVQVTELDRASWTITGYLLGYLVGIPLIGRLSDSWGHRRLFVLSMLGFMVGSVAVAITPVVNESLLAPRMSAEDAQRWTLWWLVGTRVFQAVGAGAMVPISIAMAGDLFPPGRRALPLGMIGAAAEAGGVIGPLWGGLFVRYLDWTWVFWINVPLGLAVIVAMMVLVAPSPRYATRVDFTGGALLAVSLATLTLGLARIGSPDGLLVAYAVVAAATFAAFVARQRTTEHPLLPVAMFRSWAFTAASATHLLVGAALIIAMVTIPLMANTALALTPLEGGLRLMRMTVGIPVGAVLGGLACQWLDYRVPAVAGLALAALGFVLMSGWDIQIAEPALTIHLAIAGLGFGLLIAPIALSATETVGEENRGTGAATVTAMRIVGMTLGLAALTAWGSDRFQSLVSGISLPFALPEDTAAQSQQRVEEFDSQLRDAGMDLFSEFFLIAAGLCVLAVATATFMAWSRRRAEER